MTTHFPSTTKHLQSVQEELEADTERSTSIIDTIRRPFLGTSRGGNATQKGVYERNSMERRQKTPPRTWLYKMAAKLTISRGRKGTIKSNTREEGARREGTEETSKSAGFKRKPIPSFETPMNDSDDQNKNGGQDKNDDTHSLSQRSTSQEGGTQASTQRSSASIRTPRSTEDHTANATKDQAWDFDEEVDSFTGESKGESNRVSPPRSIGSTILRA